MPPNSSLGPHCLHPFWGLAWWLAHCWDSLALIHNPFLPQIQAALGGSHDNSTPGKDQLGEKPDFTVKKKKERKKKLARSHRQGKLGQGLVLRQKTAEV